VTCADLWVLGNLTIDDLVLPDGTTSMGLCGGNAIFAALGGRVWSTQVGLAARIGPDFPRNNIERLETAGVQLALSKVDAPTLHNWALYESPDRRRFINWLDSGSHLQQSLLPAEVPAAAGLARVCHVAPMPLEVQSKLVRFLAPQPALVSLDPHDEYINGAEDALLDLLALVDLFLPSRREAALLYGRDAPEDAARAFLSRGPRAVAIKLGAEGSVVCGRGVEPVHVPAVPVIAVDPTGAGDGYCGGFCVSFGQQGDVLEAALHATVAGALMVEHRGALAALPFDRYVAEQRLEWLKGTLEPLRMESKHPCAWTNAN
jgi:sugar/nucleoside kinase (ribokinase family)